MGATGAAVSKTSYWLTEGENSDRLDDQLCRMSRMGVRTGPIQPGFCPSDEDGAVTEVELRQRLEAQVAELRLELARFKKAEV